MVSSGIVSALAEQVLRAKTRALEAEAAGKDAGAIRAVDRSLRQTLAYLIQLQDPHPAGAGEFGLAVDAAGGILVLQGERQLPVSESYLRSLFTEAGVELVPGQVLLLDAALVRMLVEEALGALSLEEAELRGAKARLVHASLEAESLGSGRPACPSCDSVEAA